MAVPGEVANPDRLRTQSIEFASDGAVIDAYLAQPAEPGPAPGLIVIHEAFGPVEHIHDVCRRFANIGYNALAPNLYARIGVPDAGDRESVFGKMFALDDAQVVRDVEAAAATLRGLEGASGTVGVIGFCSGGRQTLLTASSTDAVDAAVDCWGGFVTRATPEAETTPQRPTPIIDLVSHLCCPLYAVFGGEDQNPSPEVASELEARLALTNSRVTVEVFDGVGHAFFADYRPTYREKAAFSLWPKIVAFLEEHLR
ncbi:MAG: dienelactone hydrolase family protein [Dehalococcoidia bacterium]